jgi:hypothetical protein
MVSLSEHGKCECDPQQHEAFHCACTNILKRKVPDINEASVLIKNDRKPSVKEENLH